MYVRIIINKVTYEKITDRTVVYEKCYNAVMKMN